MNTDCPKCRKDRLSVEPLYLRRLVYQLNPIVNPDPEQFEVGEHITEWDSEEHSVDLFCQRCGYTEPFTATGFDVV